MSSKVLPPGGGAVSPVNWRRVGAPASEGSVRGAAEASTRAAAEIEQRVREAHAAGVREGEASGRSRAAGELQPVLERLAHAIEEIAAMRGQLRREAEADLVRLSLAIARRILRRELAVDAGALRGLVVGALERLQEREICRVRVHPAHAALLATYLRETATGKAVEVIADPSGGPGAVVFETEHGSLDASVESQLQEIENGLTDRLGREG